MAEYEALSQAKICDYIEQLDILWQEFLQIYIERCNKYQRSPRIDSIKPELYSVNRDILEEIFERVHQRADYFDRYHTKLKMSDFKEIGLVAFWIAKLKPYYLNANSFSGFFSAKVNEEFSLFYIFSTLAQYATKQKKRYSIKKCTPELVNELLYTMQYRDLSKEAYGCIVELLYIALTEQ